MACTHCVLYSNVCSSTVCSIVLAKSVGTQSIGFCKAKVCVPATLHFRPCNGKANANFADSCCWREGEEGARALYVLHTCAVQCITCRQVVPLLSAARFGQSTVRQSSCSASGGMKSIRAVSQVTDAARVVAAASA